MSLPEPKHFGDYLVFVDESGDHGLAHVDSGYPIFVLAFCLFEKKDYVQSVCPALQRLKFRFWGHDELVLHEHEIRKPNQDYGFLFNPDQRADFLDSVNRLVDESPFQLIVTAIRKREYSRRYAPHSNPYELALEFGMEMIFSELSIRGQGDRRTHIVVERRGKKEDDQLELAFHRICAGANALNQRLPFELVMVPKAANSTGLQFADLVARPVGIKVLRPLQPNRSFDIVEKKLRRGPDGETKDWGLKVYP